MPDSSYPERSFSITIFCSPAEMPLLPEPGVEAKSLVPVSGPLPGALSAVWTSLRIRGKGPNLDTMFCKDRRGRCDLLGPRGEAMHAQPLRGRQKRRPPTFPAGQTQQLWGREGSPRIYKSCFSSVPWIFLGRGTRPKGRNTDLVQAFHPRSSHLSAFKESPRGDPEFSTPVPPYLKGF